MTPPARTSTFDRATLVLAIGALLVITLTGSACKCGHIPPDDLLILVPCVAAGWLATLGGWFVVRALLAAPPALLACQAITDALWDGHDALWKGSPPPDVLVVDPRLAVRITLLGAIVVSALALRAARLQRAGVPVTAGSLLSGGKAATAT
jgi:hypothetical protein